MYGLLFKVSLMIDSIVAEQSLGGGGIAAVALGVPGYGVLAAVGHLSRIKRVPSRPAKKRISWYSTKTCLRHRKKAFPTTSLQRCILPGRK